MLHSSGIRNRNVCLGYLSITGSGIRHRMIDKLMLLFLLLARSHLTTRFAMRNTRYVRHPAPHRRTSRTAFHAVALGWLAEVGAPGAWNGWALIMSVNSRL